jgi:histidyl-tRNA synthetase
VVSVVVAPAEKNHAFYAQRLAQALRDAGFSAEVWFEGSLKKRLKKTSQRAIPHLIFIDEEELATETLSLKVMKTGGQHRLSLDQALVFLGSQEVL